MSNVPPLEDIAWIGSNRYGYKFAVGRSGERWLGFALGPADFGERILFFMPQVTSSLILGCRDYLQAVRLTAAVALDPESAYGGVDDWFIGPEFRGDPEELRCLVCGEIGYHDCEDSDETDE